MADEILRSPITPDTTKSNGDNLIRNSAGTSSSNSGGKRIPHYLRAATGSCHDNCKYGTHHSFEKKARIPVRKRIATPPQALGYQNSVDVLVLTEGKKNASPLKPKPSSNSVTVTGESSKQIRRVVSLPSNNIEASVQQVASSLSDKFAGSLKPTPTTVKPVPSPSSLEPSSGKSNSNAKNTTQSNLLAKRANSLTPKAVTVKSSTNASGSSSNGTSSDIKIQKKTGTSKVDVKKALASPVPSISRVGSLDARKTNKTLISVPHVKNQNRIRSVEPNKPNDENVQEKTLHVIDMDTENKTSVAVENKTPIENTLDCFENSSPDQNKIFVTVETINDQRIRSLESTENEGRPVQSTSSSPILSSLVEESLEESEYTDTEADESISEDDETSNMNQTKTLESDEYTRRHGKARVGLSQDRDGNPVKLSFRRGTVVDLQSDKNGPRRLRFKQGRVFGDHQNVKGETGRRRFKKRAELDGDSTTPDSKKVVLKHQDMLGKKDAQGLFNNVIEETASKLAQTRSSKVKALVGAFETVISLQESKPA